MIMIHTRLRTRALANLRITADPRRSESYRDVMTELHTDGCPIDEGFDASGGGYIDYNENSDDSGDSESEMGL